jgi:ATP-dependent Clp protease ATP-binding subunit ClpA
MRTEGEPTETGAPAQLLFPDRRALTTAALAAELARVVHGQEPALERVASATVAQLTKKHPSRPGSVMLIGPTGVGKTSTIEALPGALHTLGIAGAHVFRIDCGELTDSIQVTRLLGSPPGYRGHAETTPLLAAVSKPGCILLVDEVDKAHDDILDLLLGLLDPGRLTTPTGRAIDASHVVVALTTSSSSSALSETLEATPLEDRWTVQRACVEHLRSAGVPADLLARVGAFAVYREVVDETIRTEVARSAVAALGSEYGLIVGAIDPVVLAVVEDIANDGGGTGARALQHAARELLAEPFAELAGDGAAVPVAIAAGPPVSVHALASHAPPEDSSGARGSDHE